MVLLPASSNVFGNKESIVLVVVVFGEFQLLVVWWSKDIFLIGFFGKFFREDFTFDYCTGLQVSHLQADSLTHNFSIQIVSLHFFFFVFNRIGVGQRLHLGASLLFVKETIVVGDISIVDEHGR